MDNTNMYLYWGSGSVPCWKPMLALAEKGLWKDLPNKVVSFSKKEHKTEEVLKLNPRGQAPTFKDGDVVVNESGAICLYLEEKYSNDDNRLLPTDVGQRALVYQRMFESSNIQSNIMTPLFYYKMTKKKEDWDETYLKEKREAAEAEIARWSSYLGEKNYLVGDKFTMADVFFFPYVAMLVRLGVKFEKNANLQRYYDKLSKRESVQETWPPHWKEGAGPDFMADLKV